LNIDLWLRQMTEAYESVGIVLSPQKNATLLKKVGEETDDELERFGLKYIEPRVGQEELEQVMAEAVDTMTRFFFKKASHGGAIGSPGRVREHFGSTVEEHYGLSRGPFIDIVRAYWTFRLELEDLFPDSHSLALAQVLKRVEIHIAGVFFPTPGRYRVPVNERIEAQRRLLGEYAPEMDIEEFILHNPILVAEQRRDRRDHVRKMSLTILGVTVLLIVVLFVLKVGTIGGVTLLIALLVYRRFPPIGQVITTGGTAVCAVTGSHLLLGVIFALLNIVTTARETNIVTGSLGFRYSVFGPLTTIIGIVATLGLLVRLLMKLS